VPNAANYPGDYKSGQDQAGWEFYMSGSSGETAFYPASGYRLAATGAMYSERSIGFFWSSTPYNGTNGRYLYFYATNVNPQNNASRAYGFPVRCIQE
jgi:uncharacterized protein (TIGR02145 family)